jgi:hypothetical protein
MSINCSIAGILSFMTIYSYIQRSDCQEHEPCDYAKVCIWRMGVHKSAVYFEGGMDVVGLTAITVTVEKF